MTLWHTKSLKPIIFEGYTNALFSPDDNFLILYSIRNKDERLAAHPLLYSITKNKRTILLNNYQNYSEYNPIVCPNSQYILQQLREYSSYRVKNILIEYCRGDTDTLKTISNDIPLKYDFCTFSPDGQYILGPNENRQLISYSIAKTSIQQLPLPSNNSCIYVKNIDENAPMLVILRAQERSVRFLQQDLQNKTFFFLDKPKINLIPTDGSLKIAFNTPKKIFAYSQDNKNIIICSSVTGNIIASHTRDGGWLRDIIFDPKGNHLICLYTLANNRSSVIFWNASNIFSRIPGTKVTYSYIKDISFTPDGLLLTKGYETNLWDMNGDKHALLGKQLYGAFHTEDYIVTTKYKEECIRNSDEPSALVTETVAKLYCISNKSFKNREQIRQSLSLSQTLLLNEPVKRKNFFPNMPDTRTYDSLQKSLSLERYLL